MDGNGNTQFITASDLYARLGTARAPFVIDVRRRPAFDSDDRQIASAARRRPDAVTDWERDIQKSRDVVVYCVHGHEVSQSVASALRKTGRNAVYLEGGITHWKESNLPTRRKRDASENKWVTREHPKIDRIACPWLVSRFINPEAEFVYVPPNDIAKIAKEVGGTPYDIKGVEFGHHGDQCSFDAIIGNTTSMIRPSITSQRSCAAPIPHGRI